MIINLFTRTFLCGPEYLQVKKEDFPSFNFIPTKLIYKDFYENEFKGTKFHAMPYIYQIDYFYKYMKKNGYLQKYSYNFIVCSGVNEFYKTIIRYMIAITNHYNDNFRQVVLNEYQIFLSYIKHFNKWRYIINHELFHLKDDRDITSDTIINFNLLFTSMLGNGQPVASRFREPWKDILPAEYFINDKDVDKKFEMFWIYEFIDEIRQYEYTLFNQGKDIPDYLKKLHEDYEKSDYTEFALYIKPRIDEIVKTIYDNNDDESYPVIPLYNMAYRIYALWDNCTYGYSDLNHFKFNRELRDVIKSIGSNEVNLGF